MGGIASVESQASGELLDRVLSSDSLPSVPVVAVNVMSLSKDPDIDFSRMGALIGADPVLVAKLLRMSNSAYFGTRTKITSINGALVRMGLKVARMTILGFTLEADLSKKVPESFEIDRFWRHSLTTATAGRVLAEAVWPARRDDAFAAGILLDIGMIALQCALPEKYAEVLEEHRLHPTSKIEDIERRLMGLTHAEVGAELLRKWGIPEETYGPIRCHHTPQSLTADDSASDIARLASILAFSSTVSHVFYSKARGVLQVGLAETAGKQFGLTPEALDRLLERVGRDVREICDLFQLDPHTVPSYRQVRLQAAREVAKLAIELGSYARQAETIAEEHGAEVRELKAETEELKKLAATDELTQLLNRREFLRSFAIEIARARRYAHGLGLLMFDIDHFKAVNDTYGHPVGDQVLSSLGKHLRTEMRRTDIVARFGGDEFVVVLPETDLNGVLVAAEKLRLGLAEASKRWVKGAPGITVSVGAVHVPFDSPNLDSSILIDEADRCLYQAKNSGRNCTRYVA